MNKVILSGNLCHDIEVKYTTTSNKPVVSNSIAVRSDFKNADGEYDTTFINITVWNKTAEFLSNYASKGTKILVEGKLNSRSYDDKEGNRRNVTEVIVDKVELLGSKTKEETTPAPVVEESNPFEEFGEEVSIDENFLD